MASIQATIFQQIKSNLLVSQVNNGVFKVEEYGLYLYVGVFQKNFNKQIHHGLGDWGIFCKGDSTSASAVWVWPTNLCNYLIWCYDLWYNE